MAFDFAGTFNRSQFDRFVAFVQSQKSYIPDRLGHLYSEQRRIGSISFAYDADGVPTGYATAKPPDSYLAKLMSAYETLGGDPFFDLNVRNSTQPVFLVKADEAVAPQRFSNGEIYRQPGLGDAYTSEIIRQMRGWLEDSLHYRRAYLERKIRRALDYLDQLQAEIDLLNVVQGSAEAKGSIDWGLDQITDAMNDKTYRAVYDDQGADAHGKKTTAPLAAYPSGPERTETDSDQRGYDGFESAKSPEAAG